MGNRCGTHDAKIYRARVRHTGTMVEYKSVKIPASLANVIDDLVKSEEYSSRAEFVKEAIRSTLKKRGLLGGQTSTE